MKPLGLSFPLLFSRFQELNGRSLSTKPRRTDKDRTICHAFPQHKPCLGRTKSNLGMSVQNVKTLLQIQLFSFPFWCHCKQCKSCKAQQKAFPKPMFLFTTCQDLRLPSCHFHRHPQRIALSHRRIGMRRRRLCG